MTSASPQPGDQFPTPAEHLSVLLIEDNPGDARLFEEYLAESSPTFTLRHEETLETGLGALRDEQPDVLVVDLGLPDSNGAETVKAVAGTVPEIPIVVLTGQEDLEVALLAQEAGAAEYLRKEELTPALTGRTLQWAAQRTHMQQKLRQRDAWIRSISENAAAGIFRTGPTGRIEYANQALVNLLGFENETQLIGRDLTTFYADPIQQGRMLAEEGTENMEVEFERPDGSTVVALLSAEAVYDAEGRALHYDGVLTDITARAERKQQLRMLSEAVEQAQEAVLITEDAPLDEPGPRIEYVNRSFEDMTGYRSEEVLGKTPRILQGPETDRKMLESLREALEAEQEWEGETINYRKDGTPYAVQWNVSPVRDEEGALEHWVSVQRDVTERKQRRERLRILARALEQVGDKVVITDRTGRIEYVNEAFEQITGYAEDEVLGKTPRVLQSGVQEADFYEELWDTITSGDTFRAEFTNERTDGTLYVEDETISPVTGDDGTISHFVSTGRDITDRKRREQELRQAKEEAEDASRLKSALLANMSHEIRTPLTAINGFSEILKTELTGEYATLAEQVHEGGNRLLRTLDSILELSQLEAGTYDLDREDVRLAEAVEETVALLRPQADDKNVSLSTTVEEDPVGTWNDAGLTRIAQNLIENAIKFTPEGGAVTIVVREEGAEALLEVEDTGIGISEESLPEIFEAFKQESAGPDREYEGAGLGLSVVRRLTDALGGTIEVKSEKGVGSCFTVRLPKRPPEDKGAS